VQLQRSFASSATVNLWKVTLAKNALEMMTMMMMKDKETATTMLAVMYRVTRPQIVMKHPIDKLPLSTVSTTLCPGNPMFLCFKAASNA